MFRGISALNLDTKNRLAVPSRYRDRLQERCGNVLVLTVSPLDPALWLYPLPEWELVESKLQHLSDFDKPARRTKQMMRGYATDCEPDGHGRILIPQPLREFASLKKGATFIGQGNKFEVWDAKAWNTQRDDWVNGIENENGSSEALADLSL